MRQLECLDDDSILTLTDVCFHCIYIYIYIYIYSLQNRSPLKVMFLSANAGGGHRASAASLEAQFQNHFVQTLAASDDACIRHESLCQPQNLSW